MEVKMQGKIIIKINGIAVGELKDWIITRTFEDPNNPYDSQKNVIEGTIDNCVIVEHQDVECLKGDEMFEIELVDVK